MKLFERIIRKQVIYFLVVNKLLNPSQHGFRENRSCLSALLDVYHINNVYKQCSRLSGWILRTFISRDSLTLLTLFKCIVLSRLDYGSQLWSPHQIKSINRIEQVQRSFTRFITGMRPLSYDERLKSLHLYSVQRRFERYIIIYIWKILESIVPNLSQPITCYFSDRRGCLCHLEHVCAGRLGTLSYNSFRWKAVRLFNCLPQHVRNVSSCSTNVHFPANFPKRLLTWYLCHRHANNIFRHYAHWSFVHFPYFLISIKSKLYFFDAHKFSSVFFFLILPEIRCVSVIF